MAVKLVGKRVKITTIDSKIAPRLGIYFKEGEIVTIKEELASRFYPRLLCVNSTGMEQIVPVDCLRYLNNAPVVIARTSYEAQQKAKLERED